MRIRFALPLLLSCVFLVGSPSLASDMALVGARIYPSPAEPPIENGSILIHNGHILAVGPTATIKVPQDATVIDCKGLVVTAGFWNSHVHILTAGLLHAEKLSPEEVTSQLQEMFTRWGFTTVFDIASVLQNTALIRRLIESGEVNGPKILSVGEPFWVKGGKPVFAHVSNNQGIEVAVQSGVDILAHTTPSDDLWSSPFAERLTAAHMALTPTLTLWDVEARKGNPSSDQIEKGMSRAAQQLKAFSQARGQVLFGTDVGYIEQFDTSEEFTWMSRAGMTFQKILASLTTSPAQRFGYSNRSGRIAQGMNADLVVLNGDPAQSTSAFSRVRYTIRDGKVIYSKK